MWPGPVPPAAVAPRCPRVARRASEPARPSDACPRNDVVFRSAGDLRLPRCGVDPSRYRARSVAPSHGSDAVPTRFAVARSPASSLASNPIKSHASLFSDAHASNKPVAEDFQSLLAQLRPMSSMTLLVTPTRRCRSPPPGAPPGLMASTHGRARWPHLSTARRPRLRRNAFSPERTTGSAPRAAQRARDPCHCRDRLGPRRRRAPGGRRRAGATSGFVAALQWTHAAARTQHL